MLYNEFWTTVKTIKVEYILKTNQFLKALSWYFVHQCTNTIYDCRRRNTVIHLRYELWDFQIFASWIKVYRASFKTKADKDLYLLEFSIWLEKATIIFFCWQKLSKYCCVFLWKTLLPPFTAAFFVFRLAVTIISFAPSRVHLSTLLALGGTISISPLKINIVLYTWAISLVFHTLEYYAVQTSRKRTTTYLESSRASFWHSLVKRNKTSAGGRILALLF